MNVEGVYGCWAVLSGSRVVGSSWWRRRVLWRVVACSGLAATWI